MRSAWAGDLALAPSRARHAVLLAGHSWAHAPLARVRDLLDVEVILTEADEDEAREAARRWGVSEVWAASLAAADAVLHDGRTPWALRTWGRNLGDVRRRTRPDQLVARWMSPFSALPPARAARVSAASTRAMVLIRVAGAPKRSG